jgi:hypothetical protein
VSSGGVVWVGGLGVQSNYKISAHRNYHLEEPLSGAQPRVQIHVFSVDVASHHFPPTLTSLYRLRDGLWCLKCDEVVRGCKRATAMQALTAVWTHAA